MRAAGRPRKVRALVLWFEIGWVPLSTAADVAPDVAPAIVLLAAALIDFVVGDPWSWPHPVQAMGKVISGCSEWILKKARARPVVKIAGVGLGCLLIGGSGGIVWLGLWLLGYWGGYLEGNLLVWVQRVVAAVLLASCFAGRSLRRAAEEVLSPLQANDLAVARKTLAMYVGRDTEQLDASEIQRAVLETVSENAIDGVLAPLFYAIVGALLGGVPGSVGMAIAYKAASTLDSMVGYIEAPYTDLGWFSAQFEDGLTWLPCRLSVLTIALLSGHPIRVLSLCWRDARADPSPNAGWSECAYAAALGVQLGGPNIYKGKLKIKPYLGDDERAITPEVVIEAMGLTRWSFLWGLAVGIGGICWVSVASLA